MIKGKRGLALAMSILAISLTACSDDYTYPTYTWTDGHIVTIGGKLYTYDDIYKYFENTKSSAQAYFTVAKSVLAQSVTKVSDGIKSTIDTKIENLHDTWKTNARTNGTSYKEEKEKTFDSEGVEDEDELIAKYTAQEQVDENSESFKTVKTNDDGYQYYLSENLTKDYVEENAPYHVSHILIKVDASSEGEGYYNGQISADDAKQIDTVVRMLSSGRTFGDTALIASDDSSNTQYGELYTKDSMVAMQKDTSYVNEFKLGVYAYDTFLNSKTNNNSTSGENRATKEIAASLRVPGTDENKGYVTDSEVAYDIDDTLYGSNESHGGDSAGAFGIPLSACFEMNQLADMESNPSTGESITTENKKSITARQYPRNILFNNYFNYRGVSFIYDDSDEYDAKFLKEFNDLMTFKGESQVADIAAFKTFCESHKTQYGYKLDEYNYVKEQLGKVNSERFATSSFDLYGYASTATATSAIQTTTLSKIGQKKILTDEKGNEIIIARAGTSGDSGYQGIHFIIVNNDPFTSDKNGNYDKKYQYYRMNVPSSTSTNVAYSNSYAEHPSFINYVNADTNSNTTYNERRDTLQDAISNALDSEDITLWRYNLEKFKEEYGYDFTTLLGDKKTIIDQYITLTEEDSEDSANDTLDSSWETYIEELNLQEYYAVNRMVPTIGIAAFESGNLTAAMEEVCYVD